MNPSTENKTEFCHQEFQCDKCKGYRNALISIIFHINQTKSKICLDCFAPLLIKNNEETIKEIFGFMDEMDVVDIIFGFMDK